MSFPCTGCGACCRRVGSKLELLQEFGFPYKPLEDGSCEMLDNDRCSVYEDRPFICNVDKIGEYFPDKKEFYLDNIRACNTMQEEDGLDPKYRILTDL